MALPQVCGLLSHPNVRGELRRLGHIETLTVLRRHWRLKPDMCLKISNIANLDQVPQIVRVDNKGLPLRVVRTPFGYVKERM
jgi:hypothetical protein